MDVPAVTQQELRLDVERVVTLTERQKRALALVQEAGPEGLTAFELGQAMERTSSLRGAPITKQWAKQTGLELARALKKKGVVRQRRGGVYVAVNARPAGMSEEIPY